ncbi:hypothetical protein VTI74DRAFT_6246 [Chaetomium olivicolor]
MSGYKDPDRHFGKIFIHIDNSNLWIQGQRTYAELKKLDVSSDPTWRFDVGRLKQVLLSNSGLTADEKTFKDVVHLYGSTPPPVDTVWEAIASHDVDAELIAESVAQASNAYYSQVPSVFILVSGDRDNGLANVYRHPDKEVPAELFKVHILDDHLDEVTFHADTFRADRLLERLRTPVYRYEIAPQRPDTSSKNLAMIPAFAWTMEPDALRSLFMESKAKLESKGLRVLTYMEYCQKYNRGSSDNDKLIISNRFAEFVKGQSVDGDGEGDEDGGERTSEEEENGDQAEDDNDGFQEVNRGFMRQRDWFKKAESSSRMRCHWREYCSRGVGCKYGHTKKEEEHFRVYGGRKAKKFRLCDKPECITGRACFFAHSEAELFCPTCGNTGAHAMENCPERYQVPTSTARKNY